MILLLSARMVAIPSATAQLFAPTTRSTDEAGMAVALGLRKLEPNELPVVVSSPGYCVTILMAPEIVFLPYSDACGPRRYSTR